MGGVLPKASILMKMYAVIHCVRSFRIEE